MRVAGALAARRLQLGDEPRVALGRGQGHLQQLRLAEGELADRGQHAGGDAGGAGRRLGPVEHRHPGPALRGAPGAAEADHPTANEYRVEIASLGQASCLRRHYPDQVQTVGGLGATLSAVASPTPWAPVHRRCYPSSEGVSEFDRHIWGVSSDTPLWRDNRGMSLALPESAGPLRRERLRTARLYFVCDARPHDEDPEALLRAALSGGVDIVQLREKALGRAEIERAAATFRRVCDTYSALFIVNDDPDLARACDADGVHVGQDDGTVAGGARAARARRDHRPLDPLRGADRRLGRAACRPHFGRADLGDADESRAARGRPRPRPPRRRARGPSLLRHRRDRHGQRRGGRRRRGGAALRGAGDPRRRRPDGRRRRAAPQRRGRARWLSGARRARRARSRASASSAAAASA